MQFKPTDRFSRLNKDGSRSKPLRCIPVGRCSVYEPHRGALRYGVGLNGWGIPLNFSTEGLELSDAMKYALMMDKRIGEYIATSNIGDRAKLKAYLMPVVSAFSGYLAKKSLL